ncbi:MAG: lipoyl(octanoyl) transferase LipB [Bacteroidales bacterium]|nr:lipoyl(octanoyl) transferase LipB [Bacteroidales bacterium]MCF8337821.1 lipoyl(octanoyl) transferase LipB [Bacteroidales bacterium]
MNHHVVFQNLKAISFQDAWNYQEELFQKIIEGKKDESKSYKQYLLFCEHPHVYTLGKSGQEQNLLISEEFRRRKQIEYFKINRGGDITYHGPGQLVGYPIIDLEEYQLGVKSYIFHLEEVIIRTLREYGIEASRLKGIIGVWIDADKPSGARKICAIGVRTSRFVTMHGFAFNINTDLHYFDYINPCGIKDKGVTSMQKELGREVDFEEVSETVKQKFREVFRMTFI